MSKIIGSPKALLILLVAVVVFVISVLGGALGDAFGLGWIGGPVAAIQLPAEKAFAIGPYIVTNTSLLFWVAGVILIALAYAGTRKIRSGSSDAEIPSGLQNAWEAVVELWVGLAESAAGGRSGRRFLPLVFTIFIVVLFSNWIGIIPGVGTIGWVEHTEEVLEHHHGEEGEDDTRLFVFGGEGSIKWIPLGRGEAQKVSLSAFHLNEETHEVEFDRSAVGDQVDESTIRDIEEHGAGNTGILVPYFRGPSTDVNTTLAIAIVAMVAVQIWGFRGLGLSYGGKFINLKQGPIFFAVGLLEIVSEISRVISFTFRLFGNMFAGEVLLVAMAFLFPLVGIIPFLGLELFVGLIQAFIFAMLTLVFGVLATAGHGEEEH
ncbi:MAG: F0F1 ATP synthase subunit A [Chloroflexota bacterium]